MNAELISKFLDDYGTTKQLSELRKRKYICHLKKLSSLLNKDFRRITTSDLKNLDLKIKKLRTNKGTDAKDSTKRDLFIILKVFLKWMIRENYFKDRKYKILETISNSEFTVRIKDNHRNEEPILLESEIKTMVAKANNSRDKTIVSLLYETGARATEFVNIRRKDVKFDKGNCEVFIRGIKGSNDRTLPIIFSAKYLLTWFNSSPLQDPNDFLFVGTRNFKTQNKNQYNLISTRRLADILEFLGKAVGVNKPLNPHHLRHSRATNLADSGFTESQLNYWFGWVQGSDISRDYIQSSKNLVLTAYRKLYGEEAEEKIKTIKMKQSEKVTICPRCHKPVSGDAKICSNCFFTLDFDYKHKIDADNETVKRIEDLEGALKDVMKMQLRNSKILTDPKIYKIWRKKSKNIDIKMNRNWDFENDIDEK